MNFKVIASDYLNNATDEKYNKAKKILKNEGIENYKFYELDEKLYISGYVEGIFSKCILSESFFYDCECEYSKFKIGLCEHITALLLKYINYIESEKSNSNILNYKSDFFYIVDKLVDTYPIENYFDYIMIIRDDKNIYLKFYKNDKNICVDFESDNIILNEFYLNLQNNIYLNKDKYQIKSFKFLQRYSNYFFIDGDYFNLNNIELELSLKKENENRIFVNWNFKDNNEILNSFDYYISNFDYLIEDKENRRFYYLYLNGRTDLKLEELKEEIIEIEDFQKFFNDYIFDLNINTKFEDFDKLILTKNSIPKLYILRIGDKFKFKIKFELYDKELDFKDIKNCYYDEKFLENVLNELNIYKIDLDDNGEKVVDITFFVNFIENDLNKIDKKIKVLYSKNIRISNNPIIKIRTKVFDNEYKIDLDINDEILNLENMKESNYIVLKNGDIIKIPLKIKKIIKKYNENKYFKIGELIDYQDILEGDLKKVFEELKKFKELDNYELNNFKGNLRDYQVYGYNYLKFLNEYNLGGILADDMGLGKTVQVIALLSNVSLDKGALIVCPKTLIQNWKNEINTFSNLTVGEYIDDNDLNNYDILIVNYATLINRENLIKNYFDYIIIDEAQYIKNRWTKTSKVIKSLRAKNKLALTGTPIENNIEDIYSIFEFILPGYFENEDFIKKVYKNKEEKEKFIKKISPFILRRKKEDVLDELPEKFEKEVKLNMEEEQRSLYIKYLNYFRKEIKKDNINIFEALLRLRQIACHPYLVDKTFKESSGKFEFLKEFIEEIMNTNHKVIVFSQFTTMLEIIEKYLKEKDYNYSIITGKSKDRQNIVDEFNNNDNKKILLLSLKAAGIGLNITGADYVIHYDPWWNPSVEKQATDRVYRIGQDKDVFVYKLISIDSIEEKISVLKDKKNKLYEDILGDKEIFSDMKKEYLEILFD
jgi:SNF2 family DNA or RNA helicase